MLQKLVENRKIPEKGSCLCNYSKDLVHKFNPFFDGSFLHSLNLTFSHHVHNTNLNREGDKWFRLELSAEDAKNGRSDIDSS